MLSVLASKSLSLYTGVARNSVCCSQNGRNNRPFSTSQTRFSKSSIGRTTTRGIDYIREPSLNKMLAFTIAERQVLNIHGLLPPLHKTKEQQLEIARMSLERYRNPLNKYLYLNDLHDRNEKLFYNLLATDVNKYMPLVYTPTVGLACQKFGLAYKRPRGLFVSIYDRKNIRSILNNWPESDVRAICFTDGERILGLGDLGAYGMGIPIGKLVLYTALAKIQPHQCLPITLDVGTNNQDLITDPLYVGLRIPRVKGPEYFDFIAEFIEACRWRFGHNVLLQFEDFAINTAQPLLETYQDKCCTFNDDIQGTAAVSVAGLFAAQRITNKKMSENIYVFLGAGSAACGIASLLVMAIKEEGILEQDAINKIYLVDKDGLLTKNREGGVPPNAKQFERDLPVEKSFENVVATYKPTALIGCSTARGAFTPKILNMMTANADRPIIFALSNPTVNAECTAQEAYDNTGGQCIFSSGSPFPPVKHGGKIYHTGQGNNSYIFPGVALGVLVCQGITIPDIIFLESAKSLAKHVKQEDLDVGRIYPPMQDIANVSLDIAEDIVNKCYALAPEVTKIKPYENEDVCMSKVQVSDYFPVMPHVDKDLLLENEDQDFKSAEINQEACVVSVAEKVDMEVVLREVQKSKLYFDSWMFLVQIVTYYFILNPST